MNDITAAHLAILGLTALGTVVVSLACILLSGVRNDLMALNEKVSAHGEEIEVVKAILDIRGITRPNGASREGAD